MTEGLARSTGPAEPSGPSAGVPAGATGAVARAPVTVGPAAAPAAGAIARQPETDGGTPRPERPVAPEPDVRKPAPATAAPAGKPVQRQAAGPEAFASRPAPAAGPAETVGPTRSAAPAGRALAPSETAATAAKQGGFTAVGSSPEPGAGPQVTIRRQADAAAAAAAVPPAGPAAGRLPEASAMTSRGERDTTGDGSEIGYGREASGGPGPLAGCRRGWHTHCTATGHGRGR